MEMQKQAGIRLTANWAGLAELAGTIEPKAATSPPVSHVQAQEHGIGVAGAGSLNGSDRIQQAKTPLCAAEYKVVASAYLHAAGKTGCQNLCPGRKKIGRPRAGCSWVSRVRGTLDLGAWIENANQLDQSLESFAQSHAAIQQFTLPLSSPVKKREEVGLASRRFATLHGIRTHNCSAAVLCYNYSDYIPCTNMAAMSLVLTRGQYEIRVDMDCCGVIRDTMYIDGGLLSFLAGMADGTYSTDLDQAARPYLYYISFNEAFKTSQNVSDIFHTMKLPPNNLGPNYYDGTMFANDYELLLYGGLLALTDSNTQPDYNKVLGYEKYQHFLAQRPDWVEDWNSLNLPTNMTRYITQGAGVSVPSENLGFYFGGMRATNWGEIYRGVNYATSLKAANISADTLISVDMSTMRSEKWANSTLPDGVRGRANAELAWVPVTTQGVLLAIGGVIYPEDLHFPTSQQLFESGNVSPGFMKQIAIYDINNRKWYTQDTTGDIPGALTQFCSVVASAKDGSSHSVYIYGGYDGQKDPNYSDDVYVLSVPSFIWTKVFSGTTQHARAKHKCSKPYPDQMFVVGGNSPAEVGDPTSCLDGGMIQIFNLNNLTWQDGYDPNVWSEYKVPDAVVKNIGGNADGGATTTSPTTWGDNALPSLFGAKYSGSITTYYPYKAAPTNSTRPSVPIPGPPAKGGIPSWVAPLLGVVLGLVAISAIATCFMLHYRNKRNQRSGSYNSHSISGNVWPWLNSSTPAPKTPTVTSEDPSVPTPGSPLVGSLLVPAQPEEPPVTIAEAFTGELGGRELFELAAPIHEMGEAPQMTQVPQTHGPRPGTTSPISRRAVGSVASTRPPHSRDVSDVSASTEPDRYSQAAIPSLVVTPEHEGGPTSPVSPEERGDPLMAQGSGSGGVAHPARAYQQDTSRRRTASFEERF
ncbi:hypothetical protein FGG08_006676 [Glutinoglossum americanum]|uniref:Kelch repeat-containing protein n=1 Tax=Glutinoglossum americanum TaxID=1670608 RepID=A0A9P8I0E9_9PEZI|nr:hypothetical protein FGG08_006676 [Glutinoglossum americanum]